MKSSDALLQVLIDAYVRARQAVCDPPQARRPHVALIEHDTGWPAAFLAEAERLKLDSEVRCFIDHVGSTAVPNLPAKPVIDILVTLTDWRAAEVVSRSLKRRGYRLQEKVGGPEPRRFLTRTDASGGPAFNLHLVPTASEWGVRMLAFRDALAHDDALVQQYAALKTALAEQHPKDLVGYTAGKGTFVEGALIEIDDAFSNSSLLTHQRVELDRAQQLQIASVAVQLLVALAAAGSVFFNDGPTLLTFAFVGFTLALAWFEIGRRGGRHRTSGNQARRAVLLASGLGQSISPAQRLRIFDGFALSIRGRPLVREEDYFASRCRPGFQRAAELVEESAYWTGDLQKTSAGAVAAVLALIGLVLCAAAWRGVVDLTSDAQINAARVMIAALVFVLSSDVLGALLGHHQAAQTIAEIFRRIEATAARGYPEADVLLLMSDYNAAVESAPVVPPIVYRWRRRDLSRRWRAYLAAKRS